jgi:hypothetical protein
MNIYLVRRYGDDNYAAIISAMSPEQAVALLKTEHEFVWWTGHINWIVINLSDLTETKIILESFNAG